MNTPTANAPARNLDIERLRAFAVLFVVVAHNPWIQGEVAERLWILLQPWTGVDLFFVISGFVVSRAFEGDLRRYTDREFGGGRPMAAFYLKRAARILPTAFIVIALWWIGYEFFNVSGAWGDRTWSNAQITGILVGNALFFSNYGTTIGPILPVLGWYWSLCVEEHFYLIYPAFRLLVPQPARRARALAVVIVAVVFVGRWLSQDPRFLQQTSHNRFDQLALGVLIALGVEQWPVLWQRVRARVQASRTSVSLLGAAAIGLLGAIALIPTSTISAGVSLPTAADQIFQMRVGLVVTGALSAALVAIASLDLDVLSIGVRPVGQVLAWLGARSYAIYMYHLPAQWLIQELAVRYPELMAGASMPNGRVIALYLTALAVFVELNYRLVERPLIAWGRRVLGRWSLAAPRRSTTPKLLQAVLASCLLVLIVGSVALEFEWRSQYDSTAKTAAEPATRFVRSVPVDAAPAQVVRFLRAHGEDASALLLPNEWLTRSDLPLMPLSGASSRPTLLCRNNEGWLSYGADEYGFDNPPGTLRSEADIVLLGDELASGVCTLSADSTASVLRRQGFRVANLGLPGAGVLTSLAQFREYAASTRAKTVALYVFETTASNYLDGDRRSPMLARYLSPGFSQQLALHAAEVDAMIRERTDELWMRDSGTPMPHVSGEIVPVAPAFTWGHWFDFPAIKRAWHEREVAQPAPTTLLALAVPAPSMTGETADDEMSLIVQSALRTLRTDVQGSGGRLIVVFAPDRRRFEADGRTPQVPFDDSFRRLIGAAALAADVRTIDLTPAIAASKDPLSYFGQASPHYNARGMRLLAEATAMAARR